MGVELGQQEKGWMKDNNKHVGGAIVSSQHGEHGATTHKGEQSWLACRGQARACLK